MWKWIDEKFFAFAWIWATIVAAEYLCSQDLNLKDIVLLKMTYVSILLLVVVGFITCLRGLKYDVMKEIFDENNAGAALLVTGFMIAAAMVIGK